MEFEVFTKTVVLASIDNRSLIIYSYFRKPRNNLSLVLEKKEQDAELLGSDCRPNVGGQSLEKNLLKESIIPCEKSARQMKKNGAYCRL